MGCCQVQIEAGIVTRWVLPAPGIATRPRQIFLPAGLAYRPPLTSSRVGVDTDLALVASPVFPLHTPGHEREEGVVSP